MELTPDKIASFPLPLFKRYGARCCRRIQHHVADNRYGKILDKLERCFGRSPDEKLRCEAFNAANAAYHELYQIDGEFTVQVAAMCALVCACDSLANTSLLGNFRSVLERTEGLEGDAIQQIATELFHGLSVRTGWKDLNAG